METIGEQTNSTDRLKRRLIFPVNRGEEHEQTTVRGTRAFQPGKIEASKSYEWKWTRWDSSGKRRAGDGRYRLVLSAPGVTPDKVIKEFDLKNAPYLLK